jgi:predicted DNA-binding transcriptional regulator AlpA
MSRRVLRPKEARQRLGIGHTRFYEIVNAGGLRLVKLGDRAVGVLEHELDAYIDSLPERDTALSSD